MTADTPSPAAPGSGEIPSGSITLPDGSTLPRPLGGVSVVIPALNEQDAIPATVAALRAVMDRAGLAPWEVIVVDDGSSDRTGELAAAAGVRVIRHPHNQGYGRSLKNGISAARYDTIVITDADGTYPLDRIPDLLNAYAQGFDMVVGQRTGEHFRESALKSPLRMVLKALVEFTAGKTIPDINSGLRVFSRATVTGFFNQLCDTFSFTTSMTLAYMMTWRFVHYIPIDYHKRIGTTKVRLFRDSLRTLQYITQAITYYNPIKIFFLFSILCLAFSVLFFTSGVIFQIKTGFYLGAGCGLLALLVFCLGLLADLLKQIMNKPSSS